MNNKQLIGLITIMRKEMSRILRIWTQTLLPSVITTTLYFLIFGSFIGSRIGSMQSVPYITYIIPGLVMMSVITNSFSNVASTLFGSKFSKSIEEFLVSPLKPSTILLGFLSGGVFRACIVGTLVTIISLRFSPMSIEHPILMISTVLFTSTLFAMGGFLNGLFAKRFDDIAMIPTFVLTPLIYLGGVFYSIDMLPPFWRSVSLFNPILYLVNLFRFSIIGISDIAVTHALLVIGIFICIAWFSCVYLIKHQKGTRL